MMRIGIQPNTSNIKLHKTRLVVKAVSFHLFLHNTLAAQLHDISSAWVGDSDLHGKTVLDQLFW